jgi:hypothetical protein
MLLAKSIALPIELYDILSTIILSIIGATENLRSSFKLRWSRDLQAFDQHGAKKPPCLDSALSAAKSES